MKARMPEASWVPTPAVWCATKKSSAVAAIELWVPGRTTSARVRSHESWLPLQPVSLISGWSVLGDRNARAKARPPKSSVTVMAAIAPVIPMAKRRAVRWTGIEPSRTQSTEPSTSSRPMAPATKPRNATVRMAIDVVASGQRMARNPTAMAASDAAARHPGRCNPRPIASRSMPRRERISPVPAYAAAMASTVPMVMNTLAWTLRRLVTLQYTARRAVRSPSVSPTLATTLRPAASNAKWATPVATNPSPITSSARRRSTALRTATTKLPTASTARGAMSHPAIEETRIAVSSGVLWEMPTIASRASSGSAWASSGLMSSRLWRTSGVASLTLTMRRLRRPSTIARCSSRTPVWNTPWNRSDATSSSATTSSAGRAVAARCATASCSWMASTICSATISRTAGSLSMSVVTSAKPWESANVRQLHSEIIAKLAKSNPSRIATSERRPSTRRRDSPSPRMSRW